VILRRVVLNWAALLGPDLNGANLRGADLYRVDLSGADLRGAHLSGAHLEGANLERADLTDCTVTREHLAQAASLEGAKLPFDMTPPPAPEVEASAQKEQAADLRGADIQETTMPDGSKHE